jgi:hypothetical protein
METITLINPFSGVQSEKPVEEVIAAVEVFASTDECEAVNLKFAGDGAAEWLRAFESVHGSDRLAQIAFS